MRQIAQSETSRKEKRQNKRYFLSRMVHSCFPLFIYVARSYFSLFIFVGL